jgi:hypothetical protein
LSSLSFFLRLFFPFFPRGRKWRYFFVNTVGTFTKKSKLKTVFIFYPVLVPFRSHPFGFFVGARENKGMGAEKRGILLFRFLTSNETEMISMKKLKIRLEIKLTQVYF